MNNSKIKRISQVGIIVKNRDKAVEMWGKLLGVEDWNFINIEELPVPLEVDGEEKKLPIHAAIATMDNGFEIELIEPVGPCAYMDWLNEHGPGVHHFAMVMPNQPADYRVMHDAMLAEGGKDWVHAKMLGVPEGEGMDFTYVDLRETMGALVEMYNEKRE